MGEWVTGLDWIRRGWNGTVDGVLIGSGYTAQFLGATETGKALRLAGDEKKAWEENGKAPTKNTTFKELQEEGKKQQIAFANAETVEVTGAQVIGFFGTLGAGKLAGSGSALAGKTGLFGKTLRIPLVGRIPYVGKHLDFSKAHIGKLDGVMAGDAIEMGTNVGLRMQGDYAPVRSLLKTYSPVPEDCGTVGNWICDKLGWVALDPRRDEHYYNGGLPSDHPEVIKHRQMTANVSMDYGAKFIKEHPEEAAKILAAKARAEYGPEEAAKILAEYGFNPDGTPMKSNGNNPGEAQIMVPGGIPVQIPTAERRK